MFTEYYPIFGMMAAIVGAVWSLAWWLSGQFSALRHLIYERIDKTSQTILDKLEYHEQHDDTRFDAISKDLWAIRVRNAREDKITREDEAITRQRIET